VRSYKLIIAYHVYYDYYEIDRNQQSKITVHETDILNFHFTELFYRQSRLTAVQQITFHDTKITHFTFHANKYWPFTAHENTLSHPHHTNSELNRQTFLSTGTSSGNWYNYFGRHLKDHWLQRAEWLAFSIIRAATSVSCPTKRAWQKLCPKEISV
jgi:hypothetical protein